MRKRIVSYLLCAVMVLCTVVGIGMSVIAAEGEETEFVTNMDVEWLLAGDTTWQENFDYDIDGNYIVLKKYKYTGNVTNLDVPATATISGKQYKVKLNDDCSYMFDCSYIFDECRELKSISFSKDIDTSNVTAMSYMFSGTHITSLDISGFNTSNVTDMSYMFSYCRDIKSLDISNFNTSNVTNMSGMFNVCYSLTNLDLKNFNTSNVTDMSYMFNGCYWSTSFNVSSFNTSNVTDMSYMFKNCERLTNLDLKSFNTRNVTNMSSMFERCDSLTSLDLSNFNTSNVTDMSEMFRDCDSLTNLDISNFDTSKVTDMDFMFSCYRLTSLDLSGFNTSNVTDMSNMFWCCWSLTSLDLSNFDMSNVRLESYEDDMSMFDTCDNLHDIKVPLNLKVKCSLPGDYVREDNPSEYFYYLPLNQKNSITLIKTAPIGDMYRLYNNISGEHLYTGSIDEKNHLDSLNEWQYEGIAWRAPSTGDPVYRLFCLDTGEHLYTKDENEKNVLSSTPNWNYEGVAWYSYTNDATRGTPVYRLFNPNATSILASHHYTMDQNEINTLVNEFHWIYEGVAWYGL